MLSRGPSPRAVCADADDGAMSAHTAASKMAEMNSENGFMEFDGRVLGAL